MTIILTILFSIFVFFSTVKADTIDYWHVFYNETKIKEYIQYSKGEIVFNIKDIKKTDTLTVKYFCDTPCHECETQVTIESGSHFEITKGIGSGAFNPIKISAYELLQYYQNVSKDVFEVFYHERLSTSRSEKVLIFKIKLE